MMPFGTFFFSPEVLFGAEAGTVAGAVGRGAESEGGARDFERLLECHV